MFGCGHSPRYGDTRVYLEVEIRRVDCGSCAAVKQEHLAWLADNPFYTKRFAYFVGRRCRTATIKDVARELRLDGKTVKELDKQYMRVQLRRLGAPGPVVIGLDEIAIRNGRAGSSTTGRRPSNGNGSNPTKSSPS